MYNNIYTNGFLSIKKKKTLNRIFCITYRKQKGYVIKTIKNSVDLDTKIIILWIATILFSLNSF